MLPRRIAALVLPRLLIELAARDAAMPRLSPRPLAAVLLDPEREALPAEQQLTAQTRIDAIDSTARRLGLREGLTLAEAHAFVASLVVRAITHSQAQQALTTLADAVHAYAPTVSLAQPDALYLDLTGAAHLVGGEQNLCEELVERVGRLGHLARVAIASGPHLAGAIARHGSAPISIAQPGQDARMLRDLPVFALPIGEDLSCWLVRLGMVTVGDLARLPRAQLAARLGELAPQVLGMLDGVDPAPLQAYEPPPRLWEEQSWEEGVEQLSGLAFMLKRMVTNLAARLEGRALATTALELTLQLDRSIAALRGVSDQLAFRLELPTPLYRVDDLMRALRTRLERCAIEAPAIGMSLLAPVLVRAPRAQLDLSRDVTTSPDALAVLLAELSAEVGPERIGTLQLDPVHRPEARSRLIPVTSTAAPASVRPDPSAPGAALTRLLPTPLPLGRVRLRRGLVLPEPIAGARVDDLAFDLRLDGVEWWTASPVDRDYLHVWLRSPVSEAGASAWCFVDRRHGSLLLHGWKT